MNINLQISITSITEDFTVIAYEVQQDGSLSQVDTRTAAAPHSTPEWVAFTGLDKVTHVIKVFGATSGIEYNKYEKTPTVDTVTIFDYIQFSINDGGIYTPAENSNVYLNPNMIGMEASDYIAIREGKGPLFEGINIANDAINGGFALIKPGDYFEDKEQFTIMPKPVVVQTPVNDSVVGKQWGATSLSANMYVDITSATNYTPAHLRKLVRLAGASAVYTFSAISVPPSGYPIRVSNINSNGTTSPLPKVVFSNAPCKYGAGTITELSLPFGSVCEFVWDGSIWNMSLPVPDTSTKPTFHKGTVVVGDVITEKTVTVTIPDQGSTNYHISYSVISDGTAYNDNDITVVFKKVSATQFQAIFQETFAALQNLKLDYCIINF